MRSWMAVTVGQQEENLWDIQLNSCGFYKNITGDIPACRPDGRTDYHIIFVERGELTVTIDGQTQVAHKDEIVFFPPKAPQYYCYQAGENTAYYWLHFSGTKAAALLQEFPLQQRSYHVKRLPEYTAQLRQIGEIAELSAPGATFLCHAYTQQLLTRLLQSLFLEKTSAQMSRSAQIAAAIRRDPVAIPAMKELAEEYGVSQYHLIRTFTRAMGCSPGQYRSRLLGQKAKQLLLDTQLNITQIAELLGFSDPLYFSRWFKKETGISPSRFRC